MVDFDSQDRFAFIAATAGAATIVVDADERRVVEVLLTGGGSHMAAVTPNDDAVWVAAIGAQQLVEIPLDLDADEPEFAIGRTIDMNDALADTGYDWPSYSPVCHAYDDDGRAWVTLGPGIEQGGLFVFDTETAEVVHSWDPTVVRANCGLGFTDDGARPSRTGRAFSALTSTTVKASGTSLTPRRLTCCRLPLPMAWTHTASA
jgi:hypothetical protein